MVLQMAQTAKLPRNAIPLKLAIVPSPNTGPTIEVAIHLVGLTDQVRRALRASEVRDSVMKAEHACLTENAATYLKTTRASSLGSGEVTPEAGGAAVFQNLVLNLKVRSEALVVFHQDLLLVFYVPGQQPDLAKAFGALSVAQKDAEMLFAILPKLGENGDQTLAAHPNGLKADARANTGTQGRLSDSNIEDLFCWFSGPVKRTVFLLFPPEYKLQQEAMAKDL